MTMRTRESMYNVSVTLTYNGVVTPLGQWDQLTGAMMDSTETKYQPGGMVKQVSLGGKQQESNFSLQRNYDLDVDHPLMPALLAATGRGYITATRQPLDIDGNKYGKASSHGGTLKSVKPPDTNSTSEAAGMIVLEVSGDSMLYS